MGRLAHRLRTAGKAHVGASEQNLLRPLHDRLETGAAAIRRAVSPDRKHPHKVALLFGSERFGLTNKEMAHCHWLMRIPTREAHESMNLGQAVAICLYELVQAPGAAREQDAEGVRQSAEAAPPPGLDPAKAEDVERVTEMLLGLLEDSGYVKPEDPPHDPAHEAERHRCAEPARDVQEDPLEAGSVAAGPERLASALRQILLR